MGRKNKVQMRQCLLHCALPQTQSFSVLLPQQSEDFTHYIWEGIELAYSNSVVATSDLKPFTVIPYLGMACIVGWTLPRSFLQRWIELQQSFQIISDPSRMNETEFLALVSGTPNLRGLGIAANIRFATSVQEANCVLVWSDLTKKYFKGTSYVTHRLEDLPFVITTREVKRGSELKVCSRVLVLNKTDYDKFHLTRAKTTVALRLQKIASLFSP